MSMMAYKGYEATVAFDPEADLFHGEVANLRDVITFQGRSVEDLKHAMAESVEDYLAFCAERGEPPEKPFSGQVLLRLEPALHRRLATVARADGLSLNRWVARALQDAVDQGRGTAG